jgi:rhodanese-related sulfurtransferase
MKIIKSFLGLSALLLIVITLSCNKQETFTDVNEMVSAVSNEVEFISAEELKAKIDSGDIFNLIDVREAKEYYHGYIPGAINIPRGVLEFNIGKEDFWMNEGLYLPLKDEEFILICKKGGRSTLAAKSIQELGYKNVTVLKGGWKKWELTYPDIYEKDLDALGGHEEEEEVGGC